MTVIFTGEWSMPDKEADATNSLIDQGVDVITCHVDSPKVVVQNAEKRGIYVCGYHCSQAVLAPKGYLTGAEWNWEKVYTDYVKMCKNGKKIPNMFRGGLKEGNREDVALRPGRHREGEKGRGSGQSQVHGRRGS